MIGIYCIKNLTNGKIYIGQSVDVYTRLQRHFRDLRTSIHRNKDMQNDYNNGHYFIKGIVDKSTIHYIDNDEAKYIKLFKAISNGYNSIMPKIKEISFKKDVYGKISVHHRTSKKLMATIESVSICSELLRIHKSKIIRVLNHIVPSHSDYIFISENSSFDEYSKLWSEKESHRWYLDNGGRELSYKENLKSANASNIERMRESKMYALTQYDLEMNEVNNYSVITDVPMKFKRKGLRKALSGERKHYKGFIWKYDTWRK